MGEVGRARPGGPGPELLAEHAWITGRDRRVVDAAGVDGDLVPVAKAVGDARAALPPASRLTRVRASVEARPEGVAETALDSVGAGGDRQTEREHPQHERASR